MWVPVNAVRVWDGNTSGIQIGEITLPGAFIKEYRIYVEIQINTKREFDVTSKGGSDWYFQEHPILSVMDVPIGKQIRKDIPDSKRKRVLLVNAMVKRSVTFDADVEMAKKMIESITLISK